MTDTSIPYLDHIREQAEALFEKCLELDLEGIVAEPEASPYRELRGKTMWVKIKSLLAGSCSTHGGSWASDDLRKRTSAVHNGISSLDPLSDTGRRPSWCAAGRQVSERPVAVVQ